MIRLQTIASRWNPDWPNYQVVRDAAQSLFGSAFKAYNQKFKTRYRIRIDSQEQTLPKLSRAAQKAFDQFAHGANLRALHPLDWERFYRFVRVYYATRNDALLRENPSHPSLHIKKVGKFWSVRVNDRVRALAVPDGDDFGGSGLAITKSMIVSSQRGNQAPRAGTGNVGIGVMSRHRRGGQPLKLPSLGVTPDIEDYAKREAGCISPPEAAT